MEAGILKSWGRGPTRRVHFLFRQKKTNQKKGRLAGGFINFVRSDMFLLNSGNWEFALRRTRYSFVAVAIVLQLWLRADMIPVKSSGGESRAFALVGCRCQASFILDVVLIETSLLSVIPGSDRESSFFNSKPRGCVRALRLTLLLSHKRVSRKRLPCRGLFFW